MQVAETNRFATLSAAAEGSFGHTMFYSADFPAGIRHLERAAQELVGGRNRVLTHNVRNYLALQYGFTGRFADACALQNAIVADAADIGNRFIEQATRLWCNLGKALQGDWRGAEALCSAALEIGDTTDAKYMSAYAHCSRGQARYFIGDERTRGRHEFADGLTELHGLGHQLAISMYEAWYAEICALSGEVEQARSHAQCALDCSAREEHVGEIAALRALAIAEASHAQADWGLVDRHLARALELAPQRWQLRKSSQK